MEEKSQDQSQDQTKKEPNKEKEPEARKLMEIWIYPNGRISPVGPLNNKAVCIDALATAIKMVLAFKPPKKRILSGGAMHRFARKVTRGAFGGKR